MRASDPLPKPTAPAESQGAVVDGVRRRIRAEAIGILVIAVFILVYAILRYGSNINWSAR